MQITRLIGRTTEVGERRATLPRLSYCSIWGTRDEIYPALKFTPFR